MEPNFASYFYHYCITGLLVAVRSRLGASLSRRVADYSSPRFGKQTLSVNITHRLPHNSVSVTLRSKATALFTGLGKEAAAAAEFHAQELQQQQKHSRYNYTEEIFLFQINCCLALEWRLWQTEPEFKPSRRRRRRSSLIRNTSKKWRRRTRDSPLLLLLLLLSLFVYSLMSGFEGKNSLKDW